MSNRFKRLLRGAARRALEQEHPLATAFAVWELCNGPLRDNSRRVGKPLDRDLAGFSARRGG